MLTDFFQAIGLFANVREAIDRHMAPAQEPATLLRARSAGRIGTLGLGMILVLGQHVYHPTGRLPLRFENYLDHMVRREWNDTETKRIDDRVRESFIALYIAIEAERQRNERFRQEAARRAAEEHRRWEREECERRERASIEALLNEAKAWKDARQIRDYVKAMKGLGDKDARWVEWALSVADRLDPTKR